MPAVIDNRQKAIRGIKVGRSIEEVIVKRRLDIDNPISWPPGQSNNTKFNKNASRLELEERADGYPAMGAGHRQSVQRESNPQNNNSNDRNTQNQFILGDNDLNEYNSMSNYCQTLRFRIKVSQSS